MVTICVILAAPYAESVLGRFDLLDVEPAFAISIQEAERLRGHTIVPLSTRVKLAAFIGGVKSTQMARANAARNLMDLPTTGTADDVPRVAEEIGRKPALVRLVVARLVGAVSLRAAPLCDADVGIRVERRDETHIVQPEDGDDVVRGVLVAVNVRGLGEYGGEEGGEGERECKGAHSDDGGESLEV